MWQVLLPQRLGLTLLCSQAVRQDLNQNKTNQKQQQKNYTGFYTCTILSFFLTLYGCLEKGRTAWFELLRLLWVTVSLVFSWFHLKKKKKVAIFFGYSCLCIHSSEFSREKDIARAPLLLLHLFLLLSASLLRWQVILHRCAWSCTLLAIFLERFTSSWKSGSLSQGWNFHWVLWVLWAHCEPSPQASFQQRLAGVLQAPVGHVNQWCSSHRGRRLQGEMGDGQCLLGAKVFEERGFMQ